MKRRDEDIASAALTPSNWDTMVPADSIKVTVDKGWITLTGEVDWGYQKHAATRAVHGLWGLVGVTNDVVVRPMPDTSALRDDILVALDRSWFDPVSIDVAAEGGKVKLTGVVRSWYERDEAGMTAWSAPGTTSVENDIRIN
jgi:osmotically-inducible protein OsmY